MFNFIKKLFGLDKEEAPTVTTVTPDAPVVATSTVDTGETARPKPQRTRSRRGKFIADDPTTKHNEAWKEGKSPAANKPKPASKPRKPRPLSSKPK